jgi:hypothetical protein
MKIKALFISKRWEMQAQVRLFNEVLCPAVNDHRHSRVIDLD